MIKCCKWEPTGQIVTGECDPISPNCTPGVFLTLSELTEVRLEAFEAGRQQTSMGVNRPGNDEFPTYEDFNDYIKSKEGE